MKNKKSILVLVLLMLITFTACGKPSEEKIRSLMETHLQEKYGEPFVVENIGTRNANGQKFYTARIYPKAIVGTPKEDDNYYYATVNIDILANGSLRKTGDTYGEVNTKEEAEKYLLPKAKEIFGERIRLKTEPELEEKDNKDGLWYGYITPHFQDAKDKVKSNPEKYRLKLTLYLYIFDKIDNEKEKEERRKEIFEFIQYLKKERLFEYTVLDVLVIDEKVLASSYEKYKTDLEYGETIKEIVDGEEVSLPPKELRKEVVSVLGDEVKNMTDENILKNINKIMKSELTDEREKSDRGINTFTTQMYSPNLSMNLVKENFPVELEEGTLKLNKFNNVSDITWKNTKRYYLYIEKGEIR